MYNMSNNGHCSILKGLSKGWTLDILTNLNAVAVIYKLQNYTELEYTEVIISKYFTFILFILETLS